MFQNASRWKNDRPMSRTEFETRLPDDAARARYLAAKRWPGGFISPCCHGREGWEIRRERITWQAYHHQPLQRGLGTTTTGATGA